MWRDVHLKYAKEKLEKLHWSSKEFFIILYSPVSIIVLERPDYLKYVRIVVPRKIHQDFLKLHSASYPAIVRHGAFQYYEWMCFAEAMILILEEEQKKLEMAINELLKSKTPIINKLKDIIADYRKLESNVTHIRRYLAPTVLSIPEMQTASKEISKLKGMEETVTRAENQRILARDRLSAITQELWNTSESSRDWIVNLLVTVLSILSMIEVVDILLTNLGFEPSVRALYNVIAGAGALAIVTTILLYHKHLRENNLRKKLQSYFKCVRAI